MNKQTKILGIAGSLRKNSYNKALLRTAANLMPENTAFETFDLEGIPPFNQDMEDQPPQKNKQFKTKIRNADAILIATPEYNYSILGVLKNAIDWASRPPSDNAFEGKPVAIMGASTGMIGTARAQYHLRQCFVFLNMFPINRPEVMISHVAEKTDQNGTLKDEKTKQLMAQLIKNLIAWTGKIKE
jgi:chromate reductase